MGIKYVNADGLVNHVGTRGAENVIPSSYDMDGMVKEYVVDVDFNSVNASAAATVLGVTTANLALRTEIVPIPAGALILDTFFKTTEAFSATVEVDVVTAAKVADAGSPAGGIVSAGGGALGIVEGAAFTAALSQASYLDAFETAGAGTGALTTGKGKIIVRYTV